MTNYCGETWNTHRPGVMEDLDHTCGHDEGHSGAHSCGACNAIYDETSTKDYWPVHELIRDMDVIYKLTAGSMLYSPGTHEIWRWRGEPKEVLEEDYRRRKENGLPALRVDDALPVYLIWEPLQYDEQAKEPEPEPEPVDDDSLEWW